MTPMLDDRETLVREVSALTRGFRFRWGEPNNCGNESICIALDRVWDEDGRMEYLGSIYAAHAPQHFTQGLAWKVRDAQTGKVVCEGQTDRRGTFRLRDLPPGDYTLEVECQTKEPDIAPTLAVPVKTPSDPLQSLPATALSGDGSGGKKDWRRDIPVSRREATFDVEATSGADDSAQLELLWRDGVLQVSLTGFLVPDPSGRAEIDWVDAGGALIAHDELSANKKVSKLISVGREPRAGDRLHVCVNDAAGKTQSKFEKSLLGEDIASGTRTPTRTTPTDHMVDVPHSPSHERVATMPVSPLYQRLLSKYKNRDLVNQFLKDVAKRNGADASFQDNPDAFCACVEKMGTQREVAQIEDAAAKFFASSEVRRFGDFFDLQNL